MVLRPPISFDYEGHNGQGVSLVELSTRGLHGVGLMIRGANDVVLAGPGLTKITFRMLVIIYIFFSLKRLWQRRFVILIVYLFPFTVAWLWVFRLVAHY